MQIIIRRKRAQSHANIPRDCVLHDAVHQDHRAKQAQPIANFERVLRKLAEKASHLREVQNLPEDSPVIIIMDYVASHSQEALTAIKGHVHQCKNHSAQYILFARKRGRHMSSPPDQLINPSTTTLAKLSGRNRMVQHSMRIHNEEIPSRIPLDMSQIKMKSLLVEWISTWCKDTRTVQQIVTSWEVVLREVPVTDAEKAVPEPPRLMQLGPPEENAPAIPFNHDDIEATNDGDHAPEPVAPRAPEAPAAPTARAAPQRAPLTSLPSRGESLARQAANREVRTVERNPVRRDSDDSGSSDPFGELSAYQRRSLGPALAIVRALPPIPDFSTLFPVTSILLDLTNASMFYQIQIHPVGTPFASLARRSNHLINKFE